MAAQGWSSLPADLVNHVADCFLATNDIDCYKDLRIVCSNWRSVTVDPSKHEDDPRFRPSQWVMLDEHKAPSAAINVDSTFLFVNAATGRFLRRRLPLLRDIHRESGYIFITSTTDDLLVLAAKDSTPKHAVRVLNPFIGSMIRFAMPVPDEAELTAELIGPSSTLVMVSVRSNLVYLVEPQSKSFSVESHGDGPARLPLIATLIAADRHAALRRQTPSDASLCHFCRRYAVSLPGGDMLGVTKCASPKFDDIFVVYRMDAAGNITEEDVSSIGSLALFLGVRCIVVDTDRFPTIEPNCIYFQDSGNAERFIYKLAIANEIEEEEPAPAELVVEASDFKFGTYTGFDAVTASDAPFSVTEILSNYTMLRSLFSFEVGNGSVVFFSTESYMANGK